MHGPVNVPTVIVGPVCSIRQQRIFRPAKPRYLRICSNLGTSCEDLSAGIRFWAESGIVLPPVSRGVLGLIRSPVS